METCSDKMETSKGQLCVHLVSCAQIYRFFFYEHKKGTVVKNFKLNSNSGRVGFGKLQVFGGVGRCTSSLQRYDGIG
jgi:hypothetical protein